MTVTTTQDSTSTASKPPLYAKSDGETLEEHTKRAMDIFRQLATIYERLPNDLSSPSFFKEIATAIFFHDFGKAAKGFQQALFNEKRWPYRHEILSFPFVAHQHYGTQLARATVLTHHKDIISLMQHIENEGQLAKTFSERFAEIEDWTHLEELTKQFPTVFNTIFSEQIRAISIKDKTISKEPWEHTVISLRQQQYSQSKKALLFAKGLMNASDYAASAHIDTIQKPLKNMQELFPFEQYTTIQQHCLQQGRSMMIRSPTGSGKTEAALFWATTSLHGEKYRVFYVLPYTASLNAMYLRYRKVLQKNNQDQSVVGLFHGMAAYFLHKQLEEDAFYRTRQTRHKIYEPYKLTTVFQLLKPLFGIKGYEMNLLEMYGGRFIFDEIHAYNPRTLGLMMSLCRYILSELNGTILLMSATFPKFLVDLFRKHLHIDTLVTPPSTELAAFTRHRCHILPGTIYDHIERIETDIDAGKRVLVVCNTVQQAQEIYSTLQLKTEQSVLLHSKLILRDREEREQAVQHAQLLVGTQTIEVSLDIDYDTCYTEPAPIDALIQRFGRVNRRKTSKGKPCKGIVPVFVCTEGSEYDKYIYDPRLVHRSIKALDALDVLTETAVQDAVNQVYADGFSTEDQEIFDQTRKTFQHIIDEIEPFMNNEQTAAEFYQLFSAIEVVPRRFQQEYISAVQQKEYYQALQYAAKVSDRQFARLLKEQRIEESDDMLFINARYDDELGLILSEEADERQTQEARFI